jgi:hypothetical protein
LSLSFSTVSRQALAGTSRNCKLVCVGAKFPKQFWIFLLFCCEMIKPIPNSLDCAVVAFSVRWPGDLVTTEVGIGCFVQQQRCFHKFWQCTSSSLWCCELLMVDALRHSHCGDMRIWSRKNAKAFPRQCFLARAATPGTSVVFCWPRQKAESVCENNPAMHVVTLTLSILQCCTHKQKARSAPWSKVSGWLLVVGDAMSGVVIRGQSTRDETRDLRAVNTR